jgi:hypothetical protein
METIVSSLIAAAVTLIVCIWNNRAESDKSRALIEYKLTELEKKVDKHNNLIERTYKLDELTTLQEEKIKVANHRIEDLEKGAATI